MVVNKGTLLWAALSFTILGCSNKNAAPVDKDSGSPASRVDGPTAVPIEVTSKSIQDHASKNCVAEGILLDQGKWLSVLQTEDGELLVELKRDGVNAPTGKPVRVVGIATVLHPLNNSKGEPIDEKGNLVAGYSETIYYLRQAHFAPIQ